MSNTTIQILRSYANTTPRALNDGEMAYSFISNTMFIGDRTGEIIIVGGQVYANTIDNATREDLPNTLVLRDANGSANLVLDQIDGGVF